MSYLLAFQPGSSICSSGRHRSTKVRLERLSAFEECLLGVDEYLPGSQLIGTEDVRFVRKMGVRLDWGWQRQVPLLISSACRGWQEDDTLWLTELSLMHFKGDEISKQVQY